MKFTNNNEKPDTCTIGELWEKNKMCPWFIDQKNNFYCILNYISVSDYAEQQEFSVYNPVTGVVGDSIFGDTVVQPIDIINIDYRFI